MKKIFTLMAGLLLTLTGCSTQTVDDYAGKKPALDIRQYLNGPLEAWGVIFNWAGQQDTHFYVKMNATWQGNTGRLEEHFTYDDGRTDQRVWTITFSDDHNFTATAADVVGEAIGEQKGNAVNMRYTLRIPRGDSTLDLSLDDWMYKIDDKTVLNRTAMRKFGLKVGELQLLFRKP